MTMHTSFYSFIFLMGTVLSTTGILDAEIAVSYPSPQGRFGDQLSSYLHAKWVSYREGIPLLYKPFLFSDAFALHDKEFSWRVEDHERFENILLYGGEGNFSQESTLYLIPYFSECAEDRVFHPDWIQIPVDWQDEGFKALLRESFVPRQEYPSLIPKDFEGVTVALHVRRGGGYDLDASYQMWPLRFPPDSYYVESLGKLCQLFPGKPIYAHVFTDDPDPQHLVRYYASKLRNYPITFGCREENNRHDANQMIDFFGMMEFDCLIRSISNFTLIHDVIGDYKVVIAPKHFHWRYREFPYKNQFIENYVDEIELKQRCE